MKMRLVDDVVADLSENPANTYHPAIADTFVDVPAGAPADLRAGYRYADGVWTPPEASAAPAEPTSAYRTTMTPNRFKAQFGLVSQVKIRRARSYVDGADAQLDEQRAFLRDALNVLYEMLDDPRTTEIDTADPPVVAGIDFMVSSGMCTVEEAAAAKRGVPL